MQSTTIFEPFTWPEHLKGPIWAHILFVIILRSFSSQSKGALKASVRWNLLHHKTWHRHNWVTSISSYMGLLNESRSQLSHEAPRKQQQQLYLFIVKLGTSRMQGSDFDSSRSLTCYSTRQTTEYGTVCHAHAIAQSDTVCWYCICTSVQA